VNNLNTATAAAATAATGGATNPGGVGQGANANVTNAELNKDITMYRAVLKNELLGTTIDGMKDNFMFSSSSHHHNHHNGSNASTPNNGIISSNHRMNLNNTSSSFVLQPREMTSVFQYGLSPFKTLDENSIISAGSSSYYAHHSPYSLSPLSPYSQKLLRSPRKPMRKLPKVPFKVLDAPELQDDFYLNLVDWSTTNVLGVGLGTCVYLWSACTSQVTRLCDLTNREDSVSSVSWSEKGNYIAVGTFKGDVQIWDAAASKLVNTLTGHSARVGALAWNHDLLCSGSRDRNVLLRDIRVPAYEGERKLAGHKQEVCGLKWSPDHLLLASGGNDNKLLVWNVNGGNAPIQTYHDHIAAVKAIAWSPHQHGLLASGGGTADRCIRFWNTLTGQNLQSVDTGSQVCNLAWSKHSNELVSTHGYSQNQILIWKYPSMVQLAKLTGHSYRVLYLAVSPDGEAIVTGAGDETLRFWNVFNKSRCTKESKSALNLFGKIR
jgi:cell division cycle 20-like protein 1 (cofactor of APC complex)